MWHSGHSGLTEGVQAHIFGWCSQGNRLLFLTAFFACAALLEAGCRCQWCTLAASLWRAFSLLKMLGHFHLVFAILPGSERSCKVFEHGRESPGEGTRLWPPRNCPLQDTLAATCHTGLCVCHVSTVFRVFNHGQASCTWRGFSRILLPRLHTRSRSGPIPVGSHWCRCNFLHSAMSNRPT